MSKYKNKIIVISFWLILWEVLSLLISNNILFVGPIDVIKALFKLVSQSTFWLSIFSTIFKTLFGFVVAFILSFILAFISFKKDIVKELLKPVITLFKSLPIASFIILLLVWLPSNNLSIFVSFIVAFPQLYFATLSGFVNVDNKLIEMATVYKVDDFKVFKYVYLPSIKKYLLNAIKTTIGMCYKASIAAEVIAVPLNTIGENLYYSKLYLLTDELFAWSLVIIVISMMIEKITIRIIKKVGSND